MDLKKNKAKKVLIGWREWCSLPKLNIPMIEAKIDTGAATSALHAQVLNIYKKDNDKFIIFKVFTGNKDNNIICTSLLLDYKYIMSSNGIKEKRYVIKTLLVLGKTRFMTQVTLTDRSPLRYRMLLGRIALKKKFLIDPSLVNVQGHPQ